MDSSSAVKPAVSHRSPSPSKVRCNDDASPRVYGRPNRGNTRNPLHKALMSQDVRQVRGVLENDRGALFDFEFDCQDSALVKAIAMDCDRKISVFSSTTRQMSIN